MNDERRGIDALRRAIDDLTDRLPAGSPGRSAPRVSRRLAAVAAIMLAVIAGYALVFRRAERPAVTSTPGIEVKVLRVRGRDVQARVFDSARAGAVVVAPVTDATTPRRPVGVVMSRAGGAR